MYSSEDFERQCKRVKGELVLHFPCAACLMQRYYVEDILTRIMDGEDIDESVLPNVLIKREQRELVHYAEHEKDRMEFSHYVTRKERAYKKAV